jgi:hypothetical protein
MLGRRAGRPGLLGTVARTAVVAGTAKMTSNAVDRRQARKQAEAEDTTPTVPQQAGPPAGSPPPDSGGSSGLVREIERLSSLHDSGALTDEEFSSAKAALLK